MQSRGGGVAKLLRETVGTVPLQKTEEKAGNKSSYSPCLSDYLSVLNNLAQHDLNFQNLLVLHNLVSLGLEFGESRRPTDFRITTTDRKRNCLEDLMGNSRRHHQSPKEQRYMPPWSAVVKSDKQAMQRYNPQDVVVGYPAADCRFSARMGGNVHVYHPLEGGSWDPSIQESGVYEQQQQQQQQPQHLQQNYQAKWFFGQQQQQQYQHQPQQWNQGNKDRGCVQGGHATSSGGLSLEEGFESTSRDPVVTEKTPELHGGAADEHRLGFYDQESSLQKCFSWPVSISPPSHEGIAVGLDECSESVQQADGGHHEVHVPFNLEQEIQMDRRSDLERFMDAATPTIMLSTSTHDLQDKQDTLTMGDVWEFFRIPSVFGLQVPTFRGGKSVSFAHFVPSLSAVRLFTPASKPVNESGCHEDTYICDMPQYPQFMHLTFEFFQTQKPHLRRPLSEEVNFLEQTGVTGKQLPNLLLSEIHPASWFSVAWYPIYCIPEGKLRTSFLTFHSFGTEVQAMNNLCQEENKVKAQLIGIKFTSLNQDAWLRPRPDCINPPQMTEGLHDAGVLEEYLQSFANKNGMEPLPHHDFKRYQPPKNGCRAAAAAPPAASDKESSASYDRPSDLEETVDLLQRNAERLARASYRRCAAVGSGRSVEPHKCYHSDFEFFHLRS